MEYLLELFSAALQICKKGLTTQNWVFTTQKIKILKQK